MIQQQLETLLVERRVGQHATKFYCTQIIYSLTVKHCNKKERSSTTAQDFEKQSLNCVANAKKWE